ncbi:MAG: hypothetical protein NPIRA05_17920 [Nitrospirales bacterium]|nr:MAG: hypothetical protein NPIRA05_17920 [Nitrospirales bacterium]
MAHLCVAQAAEHKKVEGQVLLFGGDGVLNLRIPQVLPLEHGHRFEQLNLKCGVAEEEVSGHGCPES